MPRALPVSPSLEHLRSQAKDLLKAYRAHDPDATLRIETQLRHRPAIPTDAPGRFSLADALRVIAREYGFPSWPTLKAHVEAARSRREMESLAPVEALATPERRLSPRQRFIQELGEQIRELAERQDVASLVARLCLPLRDILAVRALLVELGSHPALVDALLKGLEDPRPRVRHDAAHLMDHLADERCTEPLRRLLSDPVPRVRRAALHSLSCDRCKLAPLPANDDVVAILIERALTDPSIQVRRHAAGGLAGDCYDARAVAALEGLLARETDPTLLRNARWALKHQQSLAMKAR
jgi:HEAT repeats/HEAT repeat associated with sister chromatid cohesion